MLLQKHLGQPVWIVLGLLGVHLDGDVGRRLGHDLQEFRPRASGCDPLNHIALGWQAR